MKLIELSLQNIYTRTGVLFTIPLHRNSLFVGNISQSINLGNLQFCELYFIRHTQKLLGSECVQCLRTWVKDNVIFPAVGYDKLHWNIQVNISLCSQHILAWRHQMETISALLALCAGNSPVTGELPSQKPVSWSFDIFFDLLLDKRLSQHSRHRWFETPSCSLWRHCNGNILACTYLSAYRCWDIASAVTFI